MTKILEQLTIDKLLTRHYYGDVVRFLFILAALIMLVTLPFLNSKLPVPMLISILSILLIGLVAGFTSPKQKSTAIINTGVSSTALIVFEFYAVSTYFEDSFFNLKFFVNQILAIIFLFALYYSVKTLRSMFFEKSNS